MIIGLLIIYYVLIFYVIQNVKPNLFYVYIGIFGFFTLFILSFQIYKTKSIKYSIFLYLHIYLLYILSCSIIDMYLMCDSKNYKNIVYKKEKKWSLFVDCVYINLALISTIGQSEISSKSTLSRLFINFKIIIVIFTYTFLLNDIISKTTLYYHKKSKKNMYR